MVSEFQEVLIEPIICLFEINFECNRALICARMMYEMKNLLGQVGIISSTMKLLWRGLIRSTRNDLKRLTKSFVITLKMTLQRLMGLKFY